MVKKKSPSKTSAPRKTKSSGSITNKALKKAVELSGSTRLKNFYDVQVFNSMCCDKKNPTYRMIRAGSSALIRRCNVNKQPKTQAILFKKEIYVPKQKIIPMYGNRKNLPAIAMVSKTKKRETSFQWESTSKKGPFIPIVAKRGGLRFLKYRSVPMFEFGCESLSKI